MAVKRKASILCKHVIERTLSMQLFRTNLDGLSRHFTCKNPCKIDCLLCCSYRYVHNLYAGYCRQLRDPGRVLGSFGTPRLHSFRCRRSS